MNFILNWMSVTEKKYILHRSIFYYIPLHFYSDYFWFSWQTGPSFSKGENTIQRINHYPVNSAVFFANTYPLDSDLLGASGHPPFEKLGQEQSVFIYSSLIINKRFFPSTSHMICILYSPRLNTRLL